MAGSEGASEDETHGQTALGEAPVLVEVRNRYDGSWSHGFEIVERVTTGDDEPRFRLRRLSDGYVLPALFTADDLIADPQ